MSAIKITEPGIYDIPKAVYHADPCPLPSASSSVLQTLLEEAPAKAMHIHPRLGPQVQEEEAEEKFDRGSAAHTLMLRDVEAFAILDFDSYRTNAAKAARAQAYLENKTPILKDKFQLIADMVAAGRRQLQDHEHGHILSDGLPERTIVWVEHIRGIDVWCRIRPDWMPNNPAVNPVVDYKTLAANINPDMLGRYASNAGWDFIDAFYRRGVKAVTGVDPEYNFVVQSPEAPFLLHVCDLPPEAKDFGESRVDEALDQWAWCCKNGVWPGYLRKRVTLNWPKWAGESFEGVKARRDYAKKQSQEMLALGLKFQAPHGHPMKG